MGPLNVRGHKGGSITVSGNRGGPINVRGHKGGFITVSGHKGGPITLYGAQKTAYYRVVAQSGPINV